MEAPALTPEVVVCGMAQEAGRGDVDSESDGMSDEESGPLRSACGW